MKNKGLTALSIITFLVNILFMIASYIVVPDGSTILYLLAVIIMLNGIFSGILFYKCIGRSKESELNASINELEKLNITLIEQKHDCLNHIQVMYGLIELQEYEEAKKYIKPVYGEVDVIKNMNKTSEPIVNALIQAEYNTACMEGIEFVINVDARLEISPLEPWELCKLIRAMVNVCKGNNKNTKKIDFKLSEKENILSVEIKSQRDRNDIINNKEKSLSSIKALVQGIGGKVREEVKEGSYEIKVAMKQR